MHYSGIRRKTKLLHWIGNKVFAVSKTPNSYYTTKHKNWIKCILLAKDIDILLYILDIKEFRYSQQMYGRNGKLEMCVSRWLHSDGDERGERKWWKRKETVRIGMAKKERERAWGSKDKNKSNPDTKESGIHRLCHSAHQQTTNFFSRMLERSDIYSSLNFGFQPLLTSLISLSLSLLLYTYVHARAHTRNVGERDKRERALT